MIRYASFLKEGIVHYTRGIKDNVGTLTSWSRSSLCGVRRRRARRNEVVTCLQCLATLS